MARPRPRHNNGHDTQQWTGLCDLLPLSTAAAVRPQTRVACDRVPARDLRHLRRPATRCWICREADHHHRLGMIERRLHLHVALCSGPTLLTAGEALVGEVSVVPAALAILTTTMN
jgi:hypothetical protein